MNHLGVFAKYWQPGEVKTRLGSEIGHDAAADLYRVMLNTMLGRCSDLGDLRSLVYSPPERGGEFAEIGGSEWNYVPQVEGDLGARMAGFASGVLAEESDRVVLLGSDCPHVPIAWVSEAFEHLADYDVVLGPSSDGGYYLVGMRGSVPPIFEGIDWSTSKVFAQTIARLSQSSLSFAVLGESFDVDDLASLRQLSEYLLRTDCDSPLKVLATSVELNLARIGDSASH